jgi:hypothetical protein
MEIKYQKIDLSHESRIYNWVMSYGMWFLVLPALGLMLIPTDLYLGDIWYHIGVILFFIYVCLWAIIIQGIARLVYSTGAPIGIVNTDSDEVSDEDSESGRAAEETDKPDENQTL